MPTHSHERSCLNAGAVDPIQRIQRQSLELVTHLPGKKGKQRLLAQPELHRRRNKNIHGSLLGAEQFQNRGLPTPFALAAMTPSRDLSGWTATLAHVTSKTPAPSASPAEALACTVLLQAAQTAPGSEALYFEAGWLDTSDSNAVEYLTFARDSDPWALIHPRETREVGAEFAVLVWDQVTANGQGDPQLTRCAAVAANTGEVAVARHAGGLLTVDPHPQRTALAAVMPTLWGHQAEPCPMTVGQWFARRLLAETAQILLASSEAGSPPPDAVQMALMYNPHANAPRTPQDLTQHVLEVTLAHITARATAHLRHLTPAAALPAAPTPVAMRALHLAGVPWQTYCDPRTTGTLWPAPVNSWRPAQDSAALAWQLRDHPRHSIPQALSLATIDSCYSSEAAHTARAFVYDLGWAEPGA